VPNRRDGWRRYFRHRVANIVPYGFSYAGLGEVMLGCFRLEDVRLSLFCLGHVRLGYETLVQVRLVLVRLCYIARRKY
jgi:hypothetical protein